MDEIKLPSQTDNQPALVDPFGRAVTYLRVSVTDRCDFRCVYCMAEDMTFLPKKDLLTLEELDRVCSAFVDLGVRKLRITGGEPLVRRNIMWLFKALSRHLGSGALDELTVTTNGSQLARFASELVDCGVKRVNVSIDTLDADKFKAITRWGSLDKVMEGIDTALAAGLSLKLNAVALKGVNEDEFDTLIKFCHDRGMDLTLIETMPLGEIDGDRTDQYLPLSQVREDLSQRWSLEDIDYNTGGPARYVRIGETGGRLGFITPMTHNLRKLQPRPPDLHRHALYVPGPGRRSRPARAAARQREQRAAHRRDSRSHLAQAEGPRLHHRPHDEAAERGPAHERDGRVTG